MAKKKSTYDLAVDEVLRSRELAMAEIRRQFKNTRPFRQEPVNPKEALLDFEDMMSREPQLRQDFGDDVVDAYIRQNKGGK